ncbi:Ribonuclease P protein subunit p25, partial [Cyphomyrmex costatus]
VNVAHEFADVVHHLLPANAEFFDVHDDNLFKANCNFAIVTSRVTNFSFRKIHGCLVRTPFALPYLLLLTLPAHPSQDNSYTCLYTYSASVSEGASRRRRRLILTEREISQDFSIAKAEKAVRIIIEIRCLMFFAAGISRRNGGIRRINLRGNYSSGKIRRTSTGGATNSGLVIAVRQQVKGGTKIRNVLGYALKEFSNYNSIVWTGTGNGIAKTISCAEIFKRKYEGLHQVTKLCYVSSEKSKEDVAKTHRIPEIHILLTKDIKDITELGYQAPEDSGKCLTMRNESAAESKTMTTTESTDDTKMDTTIESTSVGKMDTTESTGDAKMDTTTKSTSDVPCIDEQSRTMKKNKKNKRNKTTKNSELPLKKKKYHD